MNKKQHRLVITISTGSDQGNEVVEHQELTLEEGAYTPEELLWKQQQVVAAVSGAFAQMGAQAISDIKSGSNPPWVV